MNKILIVLLIIATGFTSYFLLSKKPKKQNEENQKIIFKTKKNEFDVPIKMVKLTGSNISLNMPTSWHTYQERTHNGLIYYITPYVYKDLGVFKRGLSVSVIKNVSKTEKLSPNELAQTFLNNAKKLDSKLKITNLKLEHLKGYRFQLEEKKETANSLITSLFLVADDKNDLFYSFVFQYERSKWKDTFVLRKKIFSNIKFIQ